MRFGVLLFGVLILSSLLGLTACTAPADEAVPETIDTVTGLGAVPKGEAAQKDLAVAQCQALFQQNLPPGKTCPRDRA